MLKSHQRMRVLCFPWLWAYIHGQYCFYSNLLFFLSLWKFVLASSLQLCVVLILFRRLFVWEGIFLPWNFWEACWETRRKKFWSWPRQKATHIYNTEKRRGGQGTRRWILFSSFTTSKILHHYYLFNIQCEIEYVPPHKT